MNAAPLTGAALWLRLLVIGGLWGAAYPLIRYLSAYLPPLAMAGCAARWRPWWSSCSRRAARNSAGSAGRWGWRPASSACSAACCPTPAAHRPATDGGRAGLADAGDGAADRHPAGRAAAARREADAAHAGRHRHRFLGIALIIGSGGLSGGEAVGALIVLARPSCYSISTIYVRMRPRGPAAALALGQQAASAVLSGSLALAVDGPGALVQPGHVWCWRWSSPSSPPPCR